MNRVQRALCGIRHTTGTPGTRLPITVDILRHIHAGIATSTLNVFDQHCFWACCSLAFFGFFRIGELLPTPANNHILSSDVMFYPVGSLSIWLRQSKTDKSGHGTHIAISSVSSHLCPVQALATFLPHRLARYPPGPIFIMSNGSTLTPGRFNSLLKDTISRIGLDPRRFSSHSFRAGAATTAAAAGLPDWLIKSLGRWSSSAYQIYISTPPSLLATVPQQLCDMLEHAPI